jgi:hypothetical protein
MILVGYQFTGIVPQRKPTSSIEFSFLTAIIVIICRLYETFRKTINACQATQEVSSDELRPCARECRGIHLAVAVWPR